MTHTHLLAPVIWVDAWKKRPPGEGTPEGSARLESAARPRRNYSFQLDSIRQQLEAAARRPAEVCPGEDVQGDRTSVERPHFTVVTSSAKTEVRTQRRPSERDK